MTYYEPGLYEGKIQRVHLTQSQKSHTPQIEFVVLIDTKHESGNAYEVPEKLERTVYRYITEKAVGFLEDDLEQLGFVGSKFSDVEDGQFDGKRVRLWCDHEKYEGEPREKWNFRFSERQVVPLAKDAQRKLDAMFGKRLKDKFGKAKPKQPDRSTGEVADDELPAELQEEDIPF